MESSSSEIGVEENFSVTSCTEDTSRTLDAYDQEESRCNRIADFSSVACDNTGIALDFSKSLDRSHYPFLSSMDCNERQLKSLAAIPENAPWSVCGMGNTDNEMSESAVPVCLSVSKNFTHNSGLSANHTQDVSCVERDGQPAPLAASLECLPGSPHRADKVDDKLEEPVVPVCLSVASREYVDRPGHDSSCTPPVDYINNDERLRPLAASLEDAPSPRYGCGKMAKEEEVAVPLCLSVASQSLIDNASSNRNDPPTFGRIDCNEGYASPRNVPYLPYSSDKTDDKTDELAVPLCLSMASQDFMHDTSPDRSCTSAFGEIDCDDGYARPPSALPEKASYPHYDDKMATKEEFAVPLCLSVASQDFKCNTDQSRNDTPIMDNVDCSEGHPTPLAASPEDVACSEYDAKKDMKMGDSALALCESVFSDDSADSTVDRSHMSASGNMECEGHTTPSAALLPKDAPSMSYDGDKTGDKMSESVCLSVVSQDFINSTGLGRNDIPSLGNVDCDGHPLPLATLPGNASCPLYEGDKKDNDMDMEMLPMSLCIPVYAEDSKCDTVP